MKPSNIIGWSLVAIVVIFIASCSYQLWKYSTPRYFRDPIKVEGTVLHRSDSQPVSECTLHFTTKGWRGIAIPNGSRRMSKETVVQTKTDSQGRFYLELSDDFLNLTSISKGETQFPDFTAIFTRYDGVKSASEGYLSVSQGIYVKAADPWKRSYTILVDRTRRDPYPKKKSYSIKD